MRNTFYIFLLVSFVAISVNNKCLAGDLQCLRDLSEEVKVSVINKNVKGLMNHVSKSGTYFIDDVYTYEQILDSINSKRGWLHKHLFVGDNSVKHYFETANNLHVDISYRGIGDDSAIVSYKSSNYDPLEWKECCFIKVGGKWYFDGIFSCD